MRAALEQQDGSVVHVDLVGVDGPEPIAVICEIGAGTGVLARYDRVMQGDSPCRRDEMPFYRFASVTMEGRTPKA